MDMNEMLNAAYKWQSECTEKHGRVPSHSSKCFEIDGVGKVSCSLNVASTMRTARHYRTQWQLNGKRISAPNLEELLLKVVRLMENQA